MLYRDLPVELEKCIKVWAETGFVPLEHIFDAARILTLEGGFDVVARELLIAFNVSDVATEKIAQSAEGGSMAAKGLKQYLQDHGLLQNHFRKISSDEFKNLRPQLIENPEHYIDSVIKDHPYPHYVPGRVIGYSSDWVIQEMAQSAERLRDFSDSKRSETAILVGNGPSLRHVDMDLFRGQDVFISNYAIKNRQLNEYAKGVAVTNYLVAEQEPHCFQLGGHWRFFPLWLANTFSSSDRTVFLNAIGGDLNFSGNVEKKVYWHSTVSFFWLQILFHAGYKKILMTGFDNSYNQATTAKEGDLIKQEKDDDNHFDSGYFKGKVWQAADTGKMEDTYVLSKKHYEADGREIVNCTVGGQLEVFRRAELASEIPERRLYASRAPSVRKPKVAVVTSFWEGDAESAELHWRLLNRIGYRNADHIHLFKNGTDSLPLTTLPRVVCADIQKNYPEASKKPHPAGPNLVFAHAAKMLRDTDYTHFFWMEPDCVPTDEDWLELFLDKLEQYPDEPIIGTGGGTVSPGKPFWKNHFAGCSLYSVQALSELDWESYIENSLDISFDIWLSTQLGYVEIGAVNNDDQTNTIIYGKDRYDWRLLKHPKAIVSGMFEHWRPEKFLSAEQLEERLEWKGFRVYHAIKDQAVVRRLYARQRPSLSTIIINYNNARYIHDAISSALDQSIGDVAYEVVVVDDGSTDGSQDVIRSFGDAIRPILLEHGALNANFNQQRGLRTGIEASQGDIILLLDGDDVFARDKVMTVCKMFENPDVVLGQHILNLIDGDGEDMDKTSRNFPAVAVTPQVYHDNRRVNFFQPTSGLALRRCYAMAMKWAMRPDEDEATWADVRMSRFAPYFGKIYSSELQLGAWRRHAGSDSIRTDNVAERIRKHEQWFDKSRDALAIPAVRFGWMEPSLGGDGAGRSDANLRPELEQLGASFAALEAYTRRLETDTKGKGPAGDRMVAAARWFLWSCATRLLIAPEETLSRLTPGADLDKTVGLRLKELPQNDPIAKHFRTVLNFARARLD